MRLFLPGGWYKSDVEYLDPTPEIVHDGDTNDDDDDGR